MAASAQIVGEAGIIIKPVTDGFERTLQSVLNRAGGTAFQIPVTIGTKAFEEGLAIVKGQAESGVVIPVGAATTSAEDAIGAAKGSAESGVVIPVTAGTAAAEAGVGTVVGQVEAGATLPVGADITSAQADVQSLYAQAQSGVNVPVSVGEGGGQNGASSLGAFGTALQGVASVAQQYGLRIAAGLGVTYGLGQAVSQVRSSVFGFNQQLEQASIGFETMLGSADAAKKKIEEFKVFARQTPFEFGDILTSSQRLLSFGFEAEKIIPILTQVGDASAALGQGSDGINRIVRALGQMKAKGKASGEELLQLSEIGISGMRYIAEETGKTTAELQKLQQKGLLSADVAIESILKGLEKDFGGQMARQAQTFQGAMSNVRDAINQVLAAIGAPLYKVIANIGLQLGNLLSVLSKAFGESGFRGLFGALTDAAGPMQAAVGSILDNLYKLGVAAQATTSAIVAGIKPVVLAFGGAFVTALRGALNVITPVQQAIAKLKPLVTALAAALTAVFIAKKIPLIGQLFLLTKQSTAAAAAATKEAAARKAAAVAAAQDAAATDVDAAAKQRLLVTIRASIAANKAAIIAQRQTQIAAATDAARQQVLLSKLNVGGVPLGAGGPVPIPPAIGNANAGMRAFGQTAQQGFAKAGASLKKFATAFKGEILLAVGVASFMLTKNFLNKIDEAQRKVGELAVSESTNKASKAFNTGLSFDDKSLGSGGRISKYLALQQELNDAMQQAAPTAASSEGVGGFFRRAAGAINELGFAAGRAIPFTDALAGSQDKWLAKTNAARAKVDALKKALAEMQKEFLSQTKGWKTLAKVIEDTGKSIEYLGAKKVTGADQVANTEAVRKELAASVAARDFGSGAKGKAAREKAFEAASETAKVLGQYDLPSLTTALQAAGLTMDDISTMSLPELKKKLEEAAAATDAAKAAQLGLSESLVETANRIKAAQKQAGEFGEIIYAQSNFWLAGVKATSEYANALDELDKRSQFTASALQGVTSAAQAQVESTYAQAYAATTAANAGKVASEQVDATATATAFASAKQDELRNAFLKTADAAGYTTAEATTLANALFGIPNNINIDVLFAVNKASYEAAIAAVAAVNQQTAEQYLAANFPNGIPEGSVSRDPFNLNPMPDQLTTAEKLRQAELARLFKIAADAAAVLKAAQDAQAAATGTQQKAQADAAVLVAKERKNEADKAKKDAEKKKAKDDAEAKAKKAAEEARRAQEERVRKFLEAVKRLQEGTIAMKQSFAAIVTTLQQRRNELMGNLRERTQSETGVSVTRLIKNTQERTRLLAESQRGLAALQSRGLSPDAVRALGISGSAEQAKLIRRLLRASPDELRKLSKSVGTLSETAQQAAYREQGTIIAEEIKKALEAWVEAGGKAGLSVGTIQTIIRDSKGDPAKIAAGISSRLGGVAKR
jgi:tape measure domain-containing protein